MKQNGVNGNLQDTWTKFLNEKKKSNSKLSTFINTTTKMKPDTEQTMKLSKQKVKPI